jgi:hypothetical protein
MTVQSSEGADLGWDMQEKGQPLLEGCRDVENEDLENTCGGTEVRQEVEMMLSESSWSVLAIKGRSPRTPGKWAGGQQ